MERCLTLENDIIISGIKGVMHHFPLQQMKQQMERLRIQSGDRNTHTHRLIVCFYSQGLGPNLML